MFAAVKIVLAFVIACGSLIAVIVESTHPGFVICFCVAFAVGVIAGELVRFRRRWTVRPKIRPLAGRPSVFTGLRQDA
jgi:hypothetical protein